MLYAVRRLTLGMLLVVAASAILLFSDLGHQRAARPRGLRVAILQHVNSVVLDAGIRGTLDALPERNCREGETLEVERFNAQGDMAFPGIRPRPTRNRSCRRRATSRSR